MNGVARACLFHVSYFIAALLSSIFQSDRYHRGFDACDAASKIVAEHQPQLIPPIRQGFSVPLLVASSNNAVSTAAPGKCTYRTTLPLMNTFLTEDWPYHLVSTVPIQWLQTLVCFSTQVAHQVGVL